MPKAHGFTDDVGEQGVQDRRHGQVAAAHRNDTHQDTASHRHRRPAEQPAHVVLPQRGEVAERCRGGPQDGDERPPADRTVAESGSQAGEGDERTHPGTAMMNPATGAREPWATSGTQAWTGTAPSLKARPTATSAKDAACSVASVPSSPAANPANTVVPPRPNSNAEPWGSRRWPSRPQPLAGPRRESAAAEPRIRRRLGWHRGRRHLSCPFRAEATLPWRR